MDPRPTLVHAVGLPAVGLRSAAIAFFLIDVVWWGHL